MTNLINFNNFVYSDESTICENDRENDNQAEGITFYTIRMTDIIAFEIFKKRHNYNVIAKHAKQCLIKE